MKYFLIVILSIGLYFTQLKAKITTLEQDLGNLEHNQTIKIILPDMKTDYSQIAAKDNYKNLNLKFGDKDINKENDIKFMPNITFDEDKNIEKIEIQLETKF